MRIIITTHPSNRPCAGNHAKGLHFSAFHYNVAFNVQLNISSPVNEWSSSGWFANKILEIFINEVSCIAGRELADCTTIIGVLDLGKQHYMTLTSHTCSIYMYVVPQTSGGSGESNITQLGLHPTFLRSHMPSKSEVHRQIVMINRLTIDSVIWRRPG